MSSSDIVISSNLRKRPPIPPRSRIPSRTERAANNSRPPLSPRNRTLQLSKPCSSLPDLSPSQSQLSSPISVNSTAGTTTSASISLLAKGKARVPQQKKPNEHEKRSLSPLSVAELATRFLEENVRNCIKPRIFPMESTSFPCERVPTPFVFTSRIHRRQLFTVNELQQHNYNSSAPGGQSRSRTAVVSKLSMMSNCTINQQTPVQVPTNAATPASLGGSSRNNSLAKNNGRADFASVLKKWNPPLPPALSRKLGRGSESPLGKVKVMLRICESPEATTGPGIIGVDGRRKQVTLIDPGGVGMGPNGITPEERRVGVSAPKMFAFDGIFGEDDDQGEICAASAAELVASVMAGEDGCLVSLGYSNAGKKQTMFGKPSNQKLGSVPTAISWLFKSIQEQKQKTGSRFSVRVSALEVTGGSVHEAITDLLLPFANEGDQAPGAYLLDGNGSAVNHFKGSSWRSVTAPLLNSVSEVRAPNPETAGFFLDSALDAIAARGDKEGGGAAGHFVFTLHLYQYSIDKNGKGVVGGRSRLHCVLLGNGSPSISVLSGLLLAVLNGQRHLPSSNHSKLGAILRECLGSLTCRAVVMIHISNSHSRYSETLAALQLGSRVHRLRRSRRLKMGSVGSGTGSGGSSGGSGEEMRNNLGTNNQVGEAETGSSDIDPSSSEQSCDTVIYLGPSIDEATDGEHPPVYLPALESSENKILPSKCPLNGSHAKTKSPKPKNPSFTGVKAGASEEKWIDGPKLGVAGVGNKFHRNLVSSPSKKKGPGSGSGETWIDGPAARSGVHQGINFPSPKKVQSNSGSRASNGNGHQQVPDSSMISPCCSMSMSSAKAEMIQRWISNQTHSPTFPFDDISQLDDTFFGVSSGSGQGGIFSGGGPSFMYSGQQLLPCFPEPEPIYKTLTVFKTCEDEEEKLPDEGYEFEFIEVVEPEVPVPTCDVCLQVTEEDIALCMLMGENPLPESDQNCLMTAQGIFERRSASFSECLDPEHFHGSCSTLEKMDHPLRVLSEECLTVVSTFSGSMSLPGSDMDRLWKTNPLFHATEHDNGKICHGLCKNLVTLSQMSLDHLNSDFPSIKPSEEQSATLPHKTVGKPPAAQPPPTLTSEAVFKIPAPIPMTPKLPPRKNLNNVNNKDSDAEQENISIPPMELLDVNQIKSNCHPIDHSKKAPPVTQVQIQSHPSCDHNHHHQNPPSCVNHLNINGNITLTSNGSSVHSGSPSSISTTPSSFTEAGGTPPQSLSPVVIPIQISETGKSPSKSKSRRIARFFSSRSKSPKKVVNSSGSGDSGKSSSADSSSDAKHSSSASSCSSGASIPSSGSKSKHSSPKHQSPSKKQNLKIHPGFGGGNGMDYTYTCESTLPLFLPSPSSKISENGNTGPKKGDNPKSK